jgi:hypothetical protein
LFFEGDVFSAEGVGAEVVDEVLGELKKRWLAPFRFLAPSRFAENWSTLICTKLRIFAEVTILRKSHVLQSR